MAKKTIPLLIGIVLLLSWATITGWPGAILREDLVQRRIDQALPLPLSGVKIRQHLYPHHDGLREIELQLVRYHSEEQGGQLILRLYDEQERLLAEQRLQEEGLEHNQLFTLSFPRQDESAGRRYTLEVSGEGPISFSLWGYSLDLLDREKLEVIGTESPAQELRFVTRYELTGLAAGRYLAGVLARDGSLLLLAMVLLLLPGSLLLLATPLHQRIGDPMAWLGSALALGLSIWPLLWFWLTLAGGSWSSWALWTVVVGGWLLVVALWWRTRRLSPARAGWTGQHALLLLLLVAGLAVRLLAIQPLAFPPWVDSVRHVFITSIMVEDGQVIRDYRPWLPIDRFPYHFGFHTLPAALHLMGEGPLPGLFLVLGQLLNGLVPLAIYTATWLFSRRAGAALVAALLVAFPFLFPAYYATWGRYTQLTGMLVMPPLIALTWLLIRGGRPWRSSWWVVGILAAGLFLIHLRVFLYYLPFPFLIWLGSRGRRGRPLFAAGLLALLLVGVRLWELFPRSQPLNKLTTSIEGYNHFPSGYLTSGWESYFVGLAAPALLFVLVACLRRQRWAAPPFALAAWVGSLFLLLAGRQLGLPESWLVNLNSMYITLFFPLSLLLAITLNRFWHWLDERALPVEMGRHLVLGALLLSLLLFGTHRQITILNPETILAHPPDLAALRWIEENLPPDATIAVGSWKWLGTTWSASDGGAWLLPLTGRASTTPPADYSYSVELTRQVSAFNEAVATIEDWSDPSVATFLQDHGVTHLYVGARGAILEPAELARNPALSLRYRHDGTFLFELAPPHADER